MQGMLFTRNRASQEDLHSDRGHSCKPLHTFGHDFRLPLQGPYS